MVLLGACGKATPEAELERLRSQAMAANAKAVAAHAGNDLAEPGRTLKVSGQIAHAGAPLEWPELDVLATAHHEPPQHHAPGTDHRLSRRSGEQAAGSLRRGAGRDRGDVCLDRWLSRDDRPRGRGEVAIGTVGFASQIESTVIADQRSRHSRADHRRRGGTATRARALRSAQIRAGVVLRGRGDAIDDPE
jgi:hypothetical protein